MGNPTEYQFDLANANKPTNATISEEWYPGIQNFWERSTRLRPVDPINGVRAVVIHATAGTTSDGAVSVMRDGAASFHWLVPDEDEPQHGRFVWACAPERRAAGHVRNRKHHPDVNNDAQRVNDWSLGIEIVNRANGGDSFSDWQVKATAQIVRYCWAKYPNLRHVVSHAKLDPQRRTDPGSNFPWEDFRALVLSGPPSPAPQLEILSSQQAEDLDDDDSTTAVLHATGGSQ